MIEYHKIQSIFNRNLIGDKKLIEGDWTWLEFEYLARNPWEFTEKVDGTNIRVGFENGTVVYGGRTASAQIPAKLVARLNERFLPLVSKIPTMFGNNSLTLFGEGYGPKIQSGDKYRTDQDFVLFDIRINDAWLPRSAVQNIATLLDLDTVPIIGEGTLYDAVAMVKQGFQSVWGNFQAEGIVARPKIELSTRAGARIITKIKCKDFSQ